MKLGGWLMMLTGLIIFLSLLGLPAGLDGILDTIGVDINQDTSQITSADMESSGFWGKLFGGTSGILIVLGTGAIITIGLFARGYDPSLIILPFIVTVAGLYISTFWGIIKLVIDLNQAWMTSIVGLIFGSLAVGFVMACVDYFAGR